MNKRKVMVAFVTICLFAWSAGSLAMSPVLKEIEDGFVKLNEAVRPCVVNINTKMTTSAADDDSAESPDLFRFFGIPNPEQGTPNMPNRPRFHRMATGTGLIYDKQGHIITNNHVVEGVEGENAIMVKLWNDKEYPAKIVGRDPDTDLAVIKIEPDLDLPVAKLADSSLLKVGQFAIACGSPRGFEGSLSFGHVSALGRDVNLPGMRFKNFVQTDAAINLGNSGGPLCNIDGEVIGINVAIVYGANSLGFAIPVNTVKEIIPVLIAKGKITRGYLGVKITDVKEFSESLGMPDAKGAFVQNVESDSPAARAGIRRYDVVRKVNDGIVEDANDLVRRISAITPGSDAKIEVWRDKKAELVTVKLDEFQQKASAVGSMSDRGKPVFGLTVQGLTQEITERLQLKSGTTGVVVIGVEPGSPADDAGFMQGDIITEVAQKPAGNVDEFRKLFTENAVPGKLILIGIIRGGEQQVTSIKIPKEAPPAK